MTDRDLDPRVLVVQDAERLTPQQRDTLLGWLAIQNVPYHDLPASDVKIQAPKEPGLDELLESLPEDIDYGYFSFEELMDFARSYFGENVTELAVKLTVGRVWNKLTGKYRSAHKPSLVGIRQDQQLIHLGLRDLPNPATHPINRACFSLSLTDTVLEIKRYPEYSKVSHSWNPLYGLGVPSVELLAQFAKSRTAEATAG